MALKKFLHKLTATVEELDEEQLREFCASRAGVIPIREVQPRCVATVVGEITSVRIVRKTGGVPWLEVTISDGTGKLVAMWTGRRRIAGIKPGQRVVVAGRPSPSGLGGRLLLFNPRYELLST
ncbi:MAG: OB-fold nucleic acid binding domain-containing protein [Actinomycetota bacterium]|nr:OB-fold nucleic acid binding domain-containing protein [Actinomycetota bacterium]